MTIHGELRVGNGKDQATLRYTDGPDALFVDTVFVPVSQRSKGLGSELMGRVLALADALGKPVRLKARPIGATSVDHLARLIRFYERMGFAVVEREAAAALMCRPVAVRGPAAARP